MEQVGGGYDAVVNIQGDEPLPRLTDRGAVRLVRGPGVRIATLAQVTDDPRPG